MANKQCHQVSYHCRKLQLTAVLEIWEAATESWKLLGNFPALFCRVSVCEILLEYIIPKHVWMAFQASGGVGGAGVEI